MDLRATENIPGSSITRTQKIQIQMGMEPMFQKIEKFEQMTGKERALEMHRLNEEREKRVMEEAMKLSKEKSEKKTYVLLVASKKKSKRSEPY
jgi:hypothetical protein